MLFTGKEMSDALFDLYGGERLKASLLSVLSC